MWSCHNHWNSSVGSCGSGGVCEDSTRPAHTQYCLGSASEWRNQETILQELVQIQKEGFYQIYKEVWNRGRKERYWNSAWEIEEVFNRHSCSGSYSGKLSLKVGIKVWHNKSVFLSLVFFFFCIIMLHDIVLLSPDLLGILSIIEM